jgi:hypothetical protein
LRTIAPFSIQETSNASDHSPNTEGILWHVIFPFSLFRQSLQFDLILSRCTEQQAPPSVRQRTLIFLTLLVFLVMLLILLLAGMVFFFYLVKKAMGIDFFPAFHLF